MNDASLDNILVDYNKILSQNRSLDQDVARTKDKIDKRINVCDNTNRILDNATTEFKHLTSILNKKDIYFFVFSVLLQCGIKYYIKVLREMSDKELAKKHHSTEMKNRIDKEFCIMLQERK